MKVSIVMAYYNRLQQLEFTLKTIQETKHGDYEIIVVDDASDHDQDPTILQQKYNFTIIKINKSEKKHCNSCVPYNIGFKHATGDAVIIQNPECCHIGDIITHVANNLVRGSYISFPCANMYTPQDSNKLHTIYDGSHGTVLNYMKQLEQKYGRNPKTWLNHKTIRPVAYHFLCAITKPDLDLLGGFDKRYAYGSGYDDNELVARIKNVGIKIFIPDENNIPFAIHQWHPKLQINDPRGEKRIRNQNIFKKHMLELKK